MVMGSIPPVGGMRFALAACMKAKNLDDVVVYKEALVAEDEVSAILERPIFSKDLNTKSQLDRSSSRVAPLIARDSDSLPIAISRRIWRVREELRRKPARICVKRAGKSSSPQRSTMGCPRNTQRSENG
jgi:hypothetical protein